MRKKVLMTGMLLAVCITLCGCPYESEFPLSAPGTAQVDRALIGNWKFIGTEGEDGGSVAIFSFNEHELIIISLEGHEKISAYRAFVTVIGGEKFLNVQEIDRSEGERHWLFAHYSIAGNRLTLRILEDTLMKNRKIDAPQALAAFIGENLGNKEFYGEGGEMAFERL